MTTETRKCCDCKQTLPVEKFGIDNSRKDKTNIRCHECRRIHVRGFGRYQPKPRNPNLVQPRTVNIMKAARLDTARDIGRVYVRNDGGKHIQSRGF